MLSVYVPLPQTPTDSIEGKKPPIDSLSISVYTCVRLCCMFIAVVVSVAEIVRGKTPVVPRQCSEIVIRLYRTHLKTCLVRQQESVYSFLGTRL